MGILVGMDEAGYGPNFGPLVVAATAWDVPDSPRLCQALSGVSALESGTGSRGAAMLARTHSTTPVDLHEIDLYRLLRSTVAKSASERRIAIADSKTLYHPGLGLRQLERGVHSVLLAMRQTLTRWSALIDYSAADPDGHHGRVCWPDGHDCSLPVDAAEDELNRLAVRFARACDVAGVRPLLVRARLVFAAQFNELVAYYGSKGAALSHVTVGLLREVVDALSGGLETSPCPIYAVCDKHGARNYYTALLQHHFSEHWIEPVFESHAESRYEWGPPETRVRVNFRMQGERFLPTALASMTAKYLRELAMRAFNEFWCAHVPGLRPTAGYPMDSHRFRKAIAAAQRELGIEDHVLWRKR
jgi:hypothetical protein